MLLTLVATAATGAFTFYPGFTDQQSTMRIEAYTDRGPIYELIVKCPNGTGVMSYAKGDRLYCVPDGTCLRSLQRAMSRTCG